MREVIIDRGPVGLPKVVRVGNELRLELRAGSDALRDARDFSIPISDAHVEVLRGDLGRHVLLWGMLLPLAEAAGIRNDLDEAAAVGLLDPLLLGSADEVDALCRGTRQVEECLIRFGADAALVERGELFAASRALQPDDSYDRLLRYRADQKRARQGVRLSPLDAAVLSYTGRYLEGGNIPGRDAAAVDPALIGQVEALVSVAERATAGMRVSSSRFRADRTWQRVADKATRALHDHYPDLADEAVRAVRDLVCAEASR